MCIYTTGNEDLFILKTIMSKSCVEEIIVTFLGAVATVDVLMARSKDVNLAKT